MLLSESLIPRALVWPSDFFFNEWKKAEEDRLEKLEDERKLRKQERRARRQQLKGGASCPR